MCRTTFAYALRTLQHYINAADCNHQAHYMRSNLRQRSNIKHKSVTHKIRTVSSTYCSMSSGRFQALHNRNLSLNPGLRPSNACYFLHSHNLASSLILYSSLKADGFPSFNA